MKILSIVAAKEYKEMLEQHKITTVWQIMQCHNKLHRLQTNKALKNKAFCIYKPNTKMRLLVIEELQKELKELQNELKHYNTQIAETNENIKILEANADNNYYVKGTFTDEHGTHKKLYGPYSKQEAEQFAKDNNWPIMSQRELDQYYLTLTA